MRDVTAALGYLHDSNIAHLNLKTSNILYDHRSVWKISDIGLTFTYESNAYVPRNSLYAAPEQLKCSISDIKSDIFSFGVILYEICHNTSNIDDFEKNLNTLEDSEGLPKSKYRIESFHFGFDKLIRDMIRKSSDKRITIHGVSEAINAMLSDS